MCSFHNWLFSFDNRNWFSLWSLVRVIKYIYLITNPKSIKIISISLLFFRLATATIGIIVSCSVAFFVLRWLAKDWAVKQIEKRKKLQVVVAAVTHHAFKVIFLMRFTPIPYGFQNTLYAVSGVKFWIYFLATVTGMLPVIKSNQIKNKNFIHFHFFFFFEGCYFVCLCWISSS